MKGSEVFEKYVNTRSDNALRCASRIFAVDIGQSGFSVECVCVSCYGEGKHDA